MIELDFSRCRPVPIILGDGTVEMSGVKDHVKVGVRALVNSPRFFLTDEMGLMKSAQVIIAAQFLHEGGIIDRVIVIAPASVRSVWFDPELGEFARHLWVPSRVSEYHSKLRQWGEKDSKLRWVVTNYEFIREKTRRDYLLRYCNARTMLVLDESSAIKGHRTQQTKACLKLRKQCGRVVLLNGTPIANHPGDIYSQANVLDGGKKRFGILGVESYFEFRARYAIMGGWMQKQIKSWRPEGLEEIQRKMAPYVLRRLKKDCLDLPPKLPPVVLTAVLTEKTWALYKSMRDELMAWLSRETASLAPLAVTRIMRLAQITSGFLGGIEELSLDDNVDAFPVGANIVVDPDDRAHEKSVQEIGREKHDVLLSWLDARLDEDPNIKVLSGSRFRPEVLRLVSELSARGNVEVGAIMGGQRPADRQRALRLLDPRTAPPGPAFVAVVLGSGAKGLNLTASHTVIRSSNDYSLERRLQFDDRVHRPGQTQAVSYFDIVATGPQGQKTIDHGILVMLTKKDDLAAAITGGWAARPEAWMKILEAE